MSPVSGPTLYNHYRRTIYCALWTTANLHGSHSYELHDFLCRGSTSTAQAEVTQQTLYVQCLQLELIRLDLYTGLCPLCVWISGTTSQLHH